jgi:hypothetical protein
VENLPPPQALVASWEGHTQSGAGLRNFFIKPVFHSRISPPLAKNFATEKVHLLFFRAVNERSNRS